MKKLLIGAFVVAAAIAFSVPASAGDFRTNAGPWCIDFQPVFCDLLEISTDASGNTYGEWDWVCCGSRTCATVALGQAKGATYGTRPVYAGSPASFSANFRFNPANSTTNLWGVFEGAPPNVPFSFQGDISYNFTVGSCPFASVRAGVPLSSR